MQRTDMNLCFREELHAVVSAKKLSSKNRALIEARAFVGKERSGGDEEGPEFEKESEVRIKFLI